MRASRVRSLPLRRFAALLAAVASAALIVAPSAAAATDHEFLTTFGKNSCSAPSCGSAAGETRLPRGVATDPVTGHVFVGDQNNLRVDEFTPWGEFVKAFGWDVAPAGVNEQQEVRVRASSGQFKLSFGADRLRENAEALIGAVIKAKPSAAKGKYVKGVSLSSTMGPGIQVDETAMAATEA